MQSWTTRIKERLQHTEADVPWWVNDKVRLYKFCIDNDLPIPEMYQKWRRPDLMQLAELPDQFVLKPSVMHSSWGVMILSRIEPDKYFEALTSRTLTEDEIRREQTKVFDKCKYKGSYYLFAEMRVSGPAAGKPIPFDYKVFVFHDTVALIQQIDRNDKPNRMAWFDGNFQTLELEGRVVSDWSKVKLGEHFIPDSAKAMLEIARRATVALKTPFMRVDMFTQNGNALIGEMTPAPGGPYYKDWYEFTDSFDFDLGRYWSEAEREIGRQIDGENGGSDVQRSDPR